MPKSLFFFMAISCYNICQHTQSLRNFVLVYYLYFTKRQKVVCFSEITSYFYFLFYGSFAMNRTQECGFGDRCFTTKLQNYKSFLGLTFAYPKLTILYLYSATCFNNVFASCNRRCKFLLDRTQIRNHHGRDTPTLQGETRYSQCGGFVSCYKCFIIATFLLYNRIHKFKHFQFSVSVFSALRDNITCTRFSNNDNTLISYCTSLYLFQAKYSRQ